VSLGAAGRYRVAMVVTRSFEEGVRSGRNRCLNAISEALSAAFELSTFRLHNLLETRNVLDVLGALSRALCNTAASSPNPSTTTALTMASLPPKWL